MLALLIFTLQAFYAVGMVGLAIYGFHALWLTAQLGANRTRPARLAPLPSEAWPTVTVQLPIYNERHVVRRLIDACAMLDYPTAKLEIQVLDDSDDQTGSIVTQHIESWRQQGIDVNRVTRAERSGFKAGALAAALPQAKGEFIAIFDADFVPGRGFLRQTIPHFLGVENERIGFVQGRWSHLNRDYSFLTSSQALALDGHFAVEQEARQAAGYPFGFNGSGGAWRRACIEDPAVGGWRADTLCEDLDLSYRAQMAGWQPRYLNHVEAPAEIPPQLLAFKRQQFRWAKGSVQTLRKLQAQVRHSRFPLTARLAGLFHLGNYLLHPLLLLLLLVSLPLMILGVNPAAPLALLSVTTVGPPILYAIAQRRLHRRHWLKHYAYLPILMLLGTGLCLSNSHAVWQGLRNQGGVFLRTPKFNVTDADDRWQQSIYRLPLEAVFFGEVALALYALFTAAVAGVQGKWLSIPFLLLYAAGFATMVIITLWQTRRTATPKGAATHTSLSQQHAIRYEQDRLST